MLYTYELKSDLNACSLSSVSQCSFLSGWVGFEWKTAIKSNCTFHHQMVYGQNKWIAGEQNTQKRQVVLSYRWYMWRRWQLERMLSKLVLLLTVPSNAPLPTPNCDVMVSHLLLPLLMLWSPVSLPSLLRLYWACCLCFQGVLSGASSKVLTGPAMSMPKESA